MKYTIGPFVDGYARRVNTEDGPVDKWVETFHVAAADTTGRRWMLDEGRDYGTWGAAKAVAKRVKHDPASAPARWTEIDPVYGSEAWGDEDEYALAAFEADAYGEPRPNWF